MDTPPPLAVMFSSRSIAKARKRQYRRGALQSMASLVLGPRAESSLDTRHLFDVVGEILTKRALQNLTQEVMQASWFQSTGNSAIDLSKNVGYKASQTSFHLSGASIKGLFVPTAMVTHTPSCTTLRDGLLMTSVAHYLASVHRDDNVLSLHLKCK
jgi:hypothetical protein